jgi:hypothetical protein
MTSTFLIGRVQMCSLSGARLERRSVWTNFGRRDHFLLVNRIEPRRLERGEACQRGEIAAELPAVELKGLERGEACQQGQVAEELAAPEKIRRLKGLEAGQLLGKSIELKPTEIQLPCSGLLPFRGYGAGLPRRLLLLPET